jgi:hypothetical protein
MLNAVVNAGSRDGKGWPVSLRDFLRREADAADDRANAANPKGPKSGTLAHELGQVELRAGGRVPVVGTGEHQEALREAGPRGIASGDSDYVRDDGAELQGWPAALVPEPSNPHDQNAIQVQVMTGEDGRYRLVGYLSPEDAVRYQPVVQRLWTRKAIGACTAVLEGSGEGEPLSVRLDLAPPERQWLPPDIAAGDRLV